MALLPSTEARNRPYISFVKSEAMPTHFTRIHNVTMKICMLFDVHASSSAMVQLIVVTRKYFSPFAPLNFNFLFQFQETENLTHKMNHCPNIDSRFIKSVNYNTVVKCYFWCNLC